MKLNRLLLAVALVTPALVSSTFAQAPPASAKPPVHHAATTASGAARRTTPPCATLPALSPKIPALAAGLPCARPLYSIIITPTVKADYISPMVSPEVRELLSPSPTTITLNYVDAVVGSGPLARPGKYYTVNYTGWLPDGTKFDSSFDRHEPISFPYGKHQVIQGWDTGFEGMHVGGRRRLFIPYQLAYGENGKAPIPPRTPLVFDVELVAFSDTQPPRPTPPATPANPAAPITTTPSDPTKPANPAAKPSDSVAPASKTVDPASSPTTTPTTPPNRGTQPTIDPTKPTIDPKSTIPPVNK